MFDCDLNPDKLYSLHQNWQDRQRHHASATDGSGNQWRLVHLL